MLKVLRRSLFGVAAAAVISTIPTLANAQFPNKPLRIVVPYTPGGTGEMMARLVADHMTGAMSHPTVLDHRPGGGTTIGAAAVAQAPADGHTIFMNASSFLINAQLMAKLPYDPDKDFVPITFAASNPHVLVVSPALGVNTVEGFLALAEKKGGELSYASFGIGSSNHLAFEMLKSAYAFKMIHVPYKGTQQAMADVMAGQVQAMLADLPAAGPHIRSGKLVALGLAAKRRSPTFPDLPTLGEAGGKVFSSGSWFGFLARTGTPVEVLGTLNREINKALASPDIKARLAERGMETHGTSSDEFAAFMKEQSARFAEAIRISGARIE